jgi:tetratricopeptide (TPR) repeat protein
VSRCLALAALILALAAGGSARAGPEAARVYQEAEKEIAAGKLLEGARLFEQAAALEPHPVTHLAAARSYLAAGAAAPAADHFARALDLGLAEPDRSEVAKSLAELEAALGTVTVTGTGDARLAGPELALPARLHAPPGRATLTVVRDGATRTFELEMTAAITHDFAVPEPPAPAPPPLPIAAPPPAEVERSTPALAAGISFTILGVAGLAAAGGFWSAALSSRDTYLADRTQENYDRATELETATNISWSVGAVSAGLGVLLFVIWGVGGSDPEPQEGPRPSDALLIRW